MKQTKATDGKRVAMALRVDLLGGDEPRRNGLRGGARTKRKASAAPVDPASAVASEPLPKSNADVYLTGASPAVCIATRDLFDRAHSQRGPMLGSAGGGLVPAARGGTKGKPVRSSVANARARMYPACCMTSRGVSFDSAYDETFERAAALAGVAEGIGGRAMTMAEARTEVLMRMSPREVRGKTRGPLRAPGPTRRC